MPRIDTVGRINKVPNQQQILMLLLGGGAVSGFFIGVMSKRMLEWRWRLYSCAIAAIFALTDMTLMQQSLMRQSARPTADSVVPGIPAVALWAWLPVFALAFLGARRLIPSAQTKLVPPKFEKPDDDPQDIHSESYVKGLFNEMSQTYGIVNILSSFGFAYLWRKQAVDSISGRGSRICDLMAGGAECLSHIKNRFGPDSEVHLVDWCENMCKRAESTVTRKGHGNCTVVNASALNLPAADESYDAVVSTFGLKTLASHEIEELAREVRRVLKPGGSVSMLEFSMPGNRFIRFFFRIYVQIYIPFLGWLFLGNPDNYRMLWRYTNEFGSCEKALDAFQKEGFEIEFKSRFFGSATQIVGSSKSVAAPADRATSSQRSGCL